MSHCNYEFTVDMLIKLLEANLNYLRESYKEYEDRMVRLIRDIIECDLISYAYRFVGHGEQTSITIEMDFVNFSVLAMFYQRVFGEDIDRTKIPMDPWLMRFICKVNSVKGYHINDEGTSITITSEAVADENPLQLMTWAEIIKYSTERYKEFTRARKRGECGSMEEYIEMLDKFHDEFKNHNKTTFELPMITEFRKLYLLDAVIHEYFYKARPNLLCGFGNGSVLTILPRLP